MKHYKSVEFLLNLNVKPPLHKRQAPPRTYVKPSYWRLSGDGSELKSEILPPTPQPCLQAHQTLWFAIAIGEEIPFLPARIELSVFLW